jgi:hypothetical protein
VDTFLDTLRSTHRQDDRLIISRELRRICGGIDDWAIRSPRYSTLLAQASLFDRVEMATATERRREMQMPPAPVNGREKRAWLATLSVSR